MKIGKQKSDYTVELRLIGMLIQSAHHTHDVAIRILNEVTAEYFYDEDIKQLFRIIKQRAGKELPFDLVSLLSNIEDSSYDVLQSLNSQGFSSYATLDYDIDRLSSLSRLRPKIFKLQTLLSSLSKLTEPDECHVLINSSVHEIQKESPLTSSYAKNYELIVNEVMESLDEKVEEVDIKVDGWPPLPNNAMITVAGRSGVGKTYLGIFLMDKILQARPETGAIYFNMEMDETVMVKRHLNLMRPIKNRSLKRELEDGGAALLLNKNVHLVSRPGLTFEEIEMRAKAHALKNELSVIVIDYIGAIKSQSSRKERYLDLDEIAQDLAALSKKLNCIVITLQQVNRSDPKRVIEDRTPYPYEGAGSQGCERASDWWLGIDQPQIGNPDNEAFKDIFVIKNRKQRGAHGYFEIYHLFKGGRFYETNQLAAKAMIESSISTPKTIKELYYASP